MRIVVWLLISSMSFPLFAQKNAAYFVQRAQKRMLQEDFQGALRDFNDAVALEPNNASAYVNRGMLQACYLFNKRSALYDFNKAIELSPNEPSGYYNRGSLLKDAQDYEGALKDYNRVIELSPNFAGAYYNRATLYYFFIGNKKQACTDWHKAESLGYQEASEWIAKYCKEAK
ncbi:MAG: hypothetical protein RIS47_383 [Bacteroidota bacterium]